MSHLIGSKYGNYLEMDSHEYVAGLAGNDMLNIESQTGTTRVGAFGGGGNDTYLLYSGSKAVIADSGGQDTLHLSVDRGFFHYLVGEGHVDRAVVDGKHGYIHINFYGDMYLFIKDFQGVGKLENVQYSDGFTESFDSVWNGLGAAPVQSKTMADLAPGFGAATLNLMFAQYDSLVKAENLNAQYDRPQWFSEGAYMGNKADQMGVGYTTAQDALEKGGFYGTDGAFAHFIQYGQWEEVSPLSTFDPEFYYKAKTADYHHSSIVTAKQIQDMKTMFHNAGLNAWSHYQLYGTREGLDPSAGFDTSAYMDAKLAQMQKTAPGYTMEKLQAAFSDAGLSALTHYELYGRAEGLSPMGVKSLMEVVVDGDPV